MKKIIKNNLFGFILGALLFSFIGAYAAIKLSSSEISYKDTTVEQTLNSLYISRTNNDYSTDEKVIGKWIDGKPVYQKTVFTTTPAADKLNTIVAVAELNVSIDTVVDYNVIINYATTAPAQKGSPIVLTNTLEGGVKTMISPNSYVSNPNKVLMVLTSTLFGNLPAHVTVQYTKTTD